MILYLVTSLNWDSKTNNYKNGGKNWLFVLKGKNPQKIEQRKSGDYFNYSILCYKDFVASFGFGELHISNN
jgi:hypothetical protein